MMVLKKVLLGFGTALTLFAALLVTTKTAKACDFDPDFYAAQYPDVVEVYGTDSNALYSHYLKYGVFEERYKNAEEAALGVAGMTTGVPFNSTYVDIDIDHQSMIYFEQGKAVLSSSIVTGNVSEGNNTPTGVYYIDTKVPGKYLVGPTWNVWVDRWMKFTGAVGIHDATWRSKFGGEIYKKNGSHGCVNLPHDVALKLYDMVDIGTMVVVH